MKKIFLSAFALIITLSSFAQGDSTKVEQYVDVVAIPRLFSNKVTIDLDFGESKAYLKDTRLREYNGAVKKFNTVVDALNFMGREGWVFINAYPVSLANTTLYHFAFKKLFPKAELL